MPSFAPCLSYVFLTNPTDFHSSTFCLWHPNWPNTRLSLFTRIQTTDRKYLLPRFFKRTRPLSTRNSSPGRAKGCSPKGKSEKSWSKTFEQLEVVRSAFWRGEIVSGWIPVYSLNKCLLSPCVSGGVLYTNDKGVKKTENVSFSWN